MRAYLEWRSRIPVRTFRTLDHKSPSVWKTIEIPRSARDKETNNQSPITQLLNYQMSSPNLFIYLHQFLVGHLGLAAGKFQTNGRLS